jgi:hypothetical protein
MGGEFNLEEFSQMRVEELYAFLASRLILMEGVELTKSQSLGLFKLSRDCQGYLLRSEKFIVR